MVRVVLSDPGFVLSRADLEASGDTTHTTLGVGILQAQSVPRHYAVATLAQRRVHISAHERGRGRLVWFVCEAAHMLQQPLRLPLSHADALGSLVAVEMAAHGNNVRATAAELQPHQHELALVADLAIHVLAQQDRVQVGEHVMELA